MKKLIFLSFLLINSNFIKSSQTDIDAQVTTTTNKITDASKSLVDFLDAQKTALFKDFKDSYDSKTGAYKIKLLELLNNIFDQKNSGKLTKQLKDPAKYMFDVMTEIVDLSNDESEAFHEILKKKSIEMHKNFPKAGKDMLAKNSEAGIYFKNALRQISQNAQFQDIDTAKDYERRAKQAADQIHDTAVKNQELITNTSINTAREVTEQSGNTLKAFNTRLLNLNQQSQKQLAGIIDGTVNAKANIAI